MSCFLVAEDCFNFRAGAMPATILLSASDCSLLQSWEVLAKVALHFLDQA